MLDSIPERPPLIKKSLPPKSVKKVPQHTHNNYNLSQLSLLGHKKSGSRGGSQRGGAPYHTNTNRKAKSVVRGGGGHYDYNTLTIDEQVE